jgi:hypothetical protein
MTLTDASSGPLAVALPAGTYYHSSDGSNTNTLAEALTTAANAVMTETWTFAVDTSEGGTGKYTASCTGATCTIAFSGTNLRNLLGFAGDKSGATTYTGASQAKALWLASNGFQKKNGGVGGGWVTDQQTTNTASGHVYSVMGRKYRKTRILWPMELRSRCWVENEATPNESFEQFLLDGIYAGADWGTSTGPIRFYPDADTDATYGTFSALGLEKWDPTELTEHFAGGRWMIELPMLIEVPS